MRALDAHGQHHHIRFHFHRLTEQGVGGAQDIAQAAVSAPDGLDGGNSAAHILHAVFLHRAAGELVIHLARRADIHVEHEGARLRHVIPGQNGLFGRVHAAEARTVGAVDGAVARAHTLDEGHHPGFPAVRRTLDVPGGGAVGGEHALVLKAGDHIGEAASAVFAHDRPVHEIVPCGRDHRAHLFGDDLVLHFVIDGSGGAHPGAHAAFARGELAAVTRVDHGLLGNGLREGNIDGRGLAHTFVEGVGRMPGRTFLGAGSASGAFVPVHIRGLFADGHREVAYKTADALHFGIGVELDFRVLGNVHHLGREHAAGTVHRGEGLVQLGHLAADGAFTLHHHHFDAAVRAVQRGLNARHAAADNQHALGHVELLGMQGRVAAQLFHRQPHQFGGLVGVGLAILADPRHMLADIGHFKHVPVQPSAFHRAAEGLLVHARRAGGHHHAVQTILFDGIHDIVLPRFGAGVHGIFRMSHVGIGQRNARHLGRVHRGFNIAAAMADKNAYLHDAAPSSDSAFSIAARAASAAASIRALRRLATSWRKGAGSTASLSSLRVSSGRPKASPMSCV